MRDVCRRATAIGYHGGSRSSLSYPFLFFLFYLISFTVRPRERKEDCVFAVKRLVEEQTQAEEKGVEPRLPRLTAVLHCCGILSIEYVNGD